MTAVDDLKAVTMERDILREELAELAAAVAPHGTLTYSVPATGDVELDAMCVCVAALRNIVPPGAQGRVVSYLVARYGAS